MRTDSLSCFSTRASSLRVLAKLMRITGAWNETTDEYSFGRLR